MNTAQILAASYGGGNPTYHTDQPGEPQDVAPAPGSGQGSDQGARKAHAIGGGLAFLIVAGIALGLAYAVKEA